jgi:hypothetical protein
MQHLDLGVQFMKPCLGRGWKMWSPSPCLNKHAKSHGAQKCFSVRLLCLEESTRNGLGCDLQLGIKRKSRLRLKNRRLQWIPGIGFQIENPSLSDSMPRKFIYSFILRTSVLLSLKRINIWIKGSNWPRLP